MLNKRLVMGIIVLFSSEVFAGEDIIKAEVLNVYQLDSDAKVFEMRTTTPNSCGGVYWRIKSPSETVANRKFSIVLAAFTSGSGLSFHNTETCEGNRSVVSWVRVAK